MLPFLRNATSDLGLIEIRCIWVQKRHLSKKNNFFLKSSRRRLFQLGTEVQKTRKPKNDQNDP